jgi:hypothetical protein
MTAPATHTTELLSTQPPQTVTWLHARPVTLPKPMRVKVRCTSGAQHVYEGEYRHTFDAYDEALDRYPDAARIVVDALPPLPAPVPAAAPGAA